MKRLLWTRSLQHVAERGGGEAWNAREHFGRAVAAAHPENDEGVAQVQRAAEVEKDAQHDQLAVRIRRGGHRRAAEHRRKHRHQIGKPASEGIDAVAMFQRRHIAEECLPDGAIGGQHACGQSEEDEEERHPVRAHLGDGAEKAVHDAQKQHQRTGHDAGIFHPAR